MSREFAPSDIIGYIRIYISEDLEGAQPLKSIGEVEVKRCEEGREDSGVMTRCTPPCRYLTKHIVRGYRRRKSRKLQRKGWREM